LKGVIMHITGRKEKLELAEKCRQAADEEKLKLAKNRQHLANLRQEHIKLLADVALGDGSEKAVVRNRIKISHLGEQIRDAQFSIEELRRRAAELSSVEYRPNSRPEW